MDSVVCLFTNLDDIIPTSQQRLPAMAPLNSLQTRLTASFVVLILIISSMTFLVTFRSTKQALKEITQDELLTVAAVLAAELSGPRIDSLATLQAGDESTPYFQYVREHLQHVRDAHEDITYVYTMRQTAEGIAFIVDADYGNEEDPGAAIGELYEGEPGNLRKGFVAPAVDEDFTTDEWGTFLSGYAPLRNASGHVVGLLGVDMSSDRVIAKQTFIGNTIYLVTGVAILVAGIFILIFSRTIIRDIRKMNHVATMISMGNMDVELDVERKDEIGELALSFGRMVASLKVMMMLGDDE